MPIRRRHRVGSYLVLDEESDIVYYNDQVGIDPDGVVKKKEQIDSGFSKHPQNFVRAKNDPKALELVRTVDDVVVTSLAAYFNAGETNVPTAFGPAIHLTRTVRNYVIVVGIGDMVIESAGADAFIVY